MPNYHFFAVCPRTLEPVLADELTRLGAENTKINAGGVLFDGPLSLAMAACLHSRYASRILLKIASRQYYDSHDIYDMAHVLPWEKYFSPEAKISCFTRVGLSHLGQTRITLQARREVSCLMIPPVSP